jgi:hypothetical protein
LYKVMPVALRKVFVLRVKVICRAVINGDSEFVGKWHVNVCSALSVARMVQAFMLSEMHRHAHEHL